jgi:hypothetical protein
MTPNVTKLLFRGIHEVCRKRIGGGVSHVGYFDNAEDALKVVERDTRYEAVWLSLNPLPGSPDGFTINVLQTSPNRSTKEWYTRRTSLLIDCDSVRTNGQKKSNSTETEKKASLDQAEAIRNFLSEQLQWPKPVLVDSGNGTQLRYEIDLPADQTTEDLMRNLLSGLAAKFDNEHSHVDVGTFEANRLAKLPGTWARKAPESDGRPWRQSSILEAPEREVELPAHAGQAREVIREVALEVDPDDSAKPDLPGLPADATHSLIASHFRDACPEVHNHARIYDLGRMRATFVGSRWDLADQSNVLLMAALQPLCDRLRWELPEPSPLAKRDYRRVLDSHQFRFATLQQVVPMLDKVRFDMLDSDPYLIGLPGGLVGDLRTGKTRQMERKDYLTRRLRISAKEQPTPIYDYFMRSISSANDQIADEDWMHWMERLLGYCLLGYTPRPRSEWRAAGKFPRTE